VSPARTPPPLTGVDVQKTQGSHGIRAKKKEGETSVGYIVSERSSFESIQTVVVLHETRTKAMASGSYVQTERGSTYLEGGETKTREGETRTRMARSSGWFGLSFTTLTITS